MDLMCDEYGWRDAFGESEKIQGASKDRKGTKAKPSVSVWSMRRVDHILLHPSHWKLPVKNAFVLYNPASDHLPVAMDVNVDVGIDVS
mmetsp:Transcript_22089/g.26959  ORF Transcript_22089/g.26959 Transcript_22089/m.26959 type:complete len:88 (+) Transcript_22089:77-340(+)